MTIVNLSALETILGGHSPVTRGAVTVQYWAGSRPFTEIVADEVRFSVPIREQITGDPITMDLVPTRGVCCVKWNIEDTVNRRSLPRYTSIPDVPEVDFGDLVDVDPATFEPSETGLAAWLAAVAEVQALVDQVNANTLTATVSPDDPRLLRITYPAFASPQPGVVRIPLEA